MKKLLKYILLVIIGVCYGISFYHTTYISEYIYPDHSGKLYFSIMLLWIIITFLIVYYYKKLTKTERSTKFIILMFCIIQLGFILGNTMYPKMIHQELVNNQDENLRIKFSKVDQLMKIDFDDIYQTYNIEPNIFSTSAIGEFSLFSIFLIVLSFIPILVIKNKDRNQYYE